MDGTANLLREAARAGVAHIVYISIVGVDRNPFFYYQVKRDTERVIEHSDVPWTILRATQFHDFVLTIVSSLGRVPLVMPVPKDFVLQPIEAGEVAERLVELAIAGPAGRVPDTGGPETRTSVELARAYLDFTNSSARIVEVPLPGQTARAFRDGAQITSNPPWGTITWGGFLRRRQPGST